MFYNLFILSFIYFLFYSKYHSVKYSSTEATVRKTEIRPGKDKSYCLALIYLCCFAISLCVEKSAEFYNLKKWKA